jgi:endoribonuclease LACTB2
MYSLMSTITIVNVGYRYMEITTHDNITIPCIDSRSLLEQVGIAGEVVHTPGHSDDSLSLLLDNGAVFTGDLPQLLQVTHHS